MATTIGPAAINRPTVQGGDQTLIQKTNPATADFYINKVQIYSSVSLTGVKVGIFEEVSTDTFTSRSVATIGAVGSGLTSHDVTPMEVQSGDYIGIYFTDPGGGGIELSTSGFSGNWYGLPSPPFTSQVGTFQSARANSIQGISEEPDTPTNSTPTNEATNQNVILEFTASTYVSPCFATHTASQWQITTTSGDYSSPTFDSGTDTSNLEAMITSSGDIDYEITYYWHVRYYDSNGNWSSYSSETAFTTISIPDTPTNSSPSDEATGQAQDITLTSSDFVGTGSHVASQWQIANRPFGTIAAPYPIDSGTDTSNLTTYSLTNLSWATNYYWRVRYQTGHETWSSYSTPTSFWVYQKGGINNLVSMIKEVRDQQPIRRTECEQCAWPLNEHPTKGLHCVLCGWMEFPYVRKSIDDA